MDAPLNPNKQPTLNSSKLYSWSSIKSTAIVSLNDELIELFSDSRRQHINPKLNEMRSILPNK